jgi:aconitase (EC 4.2.1.3)
MDRAMDENKEVYDFLASASNKHGIGFGIQAPVSSTR